MRTESVEPGVPLAEEQVTWPIDRWLQQAQALMQDPLRQLLQMGELNFPALDDPLDTERDRREEDPLGDRSSRSAQDLVSLGKELFGALFCDSMRDSWMMAQAIAQHRQQPLRLRLGIKDEALNRLPWEVLHDIDQPLTAGTDILFSRYRPRSLQSPLPEPLAAQEPLRILMAIATPNDRVELALAEETRNLLEELEQSQTAMEIKLLEQPSRQSLTQALERGNYRIFHYAGHSVSGPHGGAISLVNEKNGLAERMLGDDLAGLLANNGIVFALFNSCRGAHREVAGNTGDGAGNLAEASIERRIPAVLAMAERIPDDVALTLTRLFYRNLSQGLAIDRSLSRARQGLISSFGSRQLYWALPVFYLHPEFDGHLTATTANVQAPWQGRHRSLPEIATTDPTLPADADKPRDAVETPSDLAATPNAIAPPPIEAETIAIDTQELLPDLLPDDALLDGLTETPLVAPTDEAIALPALTTPAETPLLEGQSEPATLATANVAPIAPSRLPTRPTTAPPPKTPRSSTLPTTAIVLAASVAIAFLGWSAWRQRLPAVPGLEPDRNRPTFNAQPTATNLDALASQASTAIARGDWNTALPIVEQLLDLGALERARSLLDLVPEGAIDRGDVQFLRGRWAWQTRISGQLDANYDDAWRDWARAVERQPDNLLYRTALGWAYFADDRLDEADVVWREALALLRSKGSSLSVSGSNLERQTVELSLQAGLALGLDRRNQTEDAIALRDFIVAEDELLQLQPQPLAQNWLWTAEAIYQWQTLLADRPAIGTPRATTP